MIHIISLEQDVRSDLIRKEVGKCFFSTQAEIRGREVFGDQQQFSQAFGRGVALKNCFLHYGNFANACNTNVNVKEVKWQKQY